MRPSSNVRRSPPRARASAAATRGEPPSPGTGAFGRTAGAAGAGGRRDGHGGHLSLPGGGRAGRPRRAAGRGTRGGRGRARGGRTRRGPSRPRPRGRGAGSRRGIPRGRSRGIPVRAAAASRISGACVFAYSRDHRNGSGGTDGRTAHTAKTNGRPVSRLHPSARSSTWRPERSAFSAGSPMRSAASWCASISSRSGAAAWNCGVTPRRSWKRIRAIAADERDATSSATVFAASSGWRLTRMTLRTRSRDAIPTPRTIRMPGMRAASTDGTSPASTSPRARRSAHADGMSVSASTPSTARRAGDPTSAARR